MKIFFLLTTILYSAVTYSQAVIIKECHDSVTYRVIEYLNNKNPNLTYEISRDQNGEMNGIHESSNRAPAYKFIKASAQGINYQTNIYANKTSELSAEYEVPTCKMRSIHEL